jgi:hypothetical protein
VNCKGQRRGSGDNENTNPMKYDCGAPE